MCAKAWVNAALTAVAASATEEGSSGSYAFGSVDGDPAADKFPIKMKDLARAAGLAFLREKGLLVDDEDSDDEPDFSAFDC